MMEKENQSNEITKWITIILNTFAVLFLLLAVYYMGWSIWKQENFSSIIVYSIALSLSFIAVQKVLNNYKTFLWFAAGAILFCIMGIFHVDVTSIFY